MKTGHSLVTLSTAVAFAAAALAAEASAQMRTVSPTGPAWGEVRAVSLSKPRPLAGIHACAGSKVEDGNAWRTLLAARQMDDDRAREVLAELHDSLTREVQARPDDIDLQYLAGVVAGSRADVEGGRTAVALAQEMSRRIRRILEVEPDHPGAHHLLGRLHAAVLRMDGFTRFVATRLLGGGELASASWEEARARLELAVAGAPCVPDHHYELARLYAERGEVRPAIEQLQSLLELAEADGLYADVHRKGRVLLARLEGRS